MKNINVLLKEIECGVDMLNYENDDLVGKERKDFEKQLDLKSKLAIAILLKSINDNLYEISHFGIGTD